MTRPHATPDMTIGDKIRADREASGLTQEELADALGTSRYQVMRWEGDKNAPTAYAAALAKFFKRPDGYFELPPAPPAAGSPEEIAELRETVARLERAVEELQRGGQSQP